MRAEDIELLVELNSDAEVMEYISGRASSAEESATELHRALGTRWLVFVSTTGEFLGWVGAVPVDKGEFDVGWRFRRACWGHGYASEARLLSRSCSSMGRVGCLPRRWRSTSVPGL